MKNKIVLGSLMTAVVMFFAAASQSMGASSYPTYPTRPPVYQNKPPVANAGVDVVTECSNFSGAVVALNGAKSYDQEGTPLKYKWFAMTPAGPWTANISDPYITLPLGTHRITLVVSDGLNVSAPDEVMVTVRDTTPPTVSFSVEPESLWPPNHKYINLFQSLGVTDSCDMVPSISVSVVSNEPDDGTGDGDTPNDILIDSTTGDITVRAERAGNGTGREYMIMYTVRDASGNSAHAEGSVMVPISKGADASAEAPGRNK